LILAETVHHFTELNPCGFVGIAVLGVDAEFYALAVLDLQKKLGKRDQQGMSDLEQARLVGLR